MDYATLRTTVDGHLDAVRQAFAAYEAASSVRLVKAGESLQAALDAGGTIALEGSATWEGTFVPSKPGTILRGNGATLRGTAGPALLVRPGSTDFQASALQCFSTVATASPVQLGAADQSQPTLADVPQRIALREVTVPSHRGKRAFGVHAANVLLEDCGATDVWTTGQDSQGWWIHNTPGPVKILGGTWSAGSELGLLGGAVFIIPHCIPTDIEVAHGLYMRPPEWQTDGVDREVKNGLEAKIGRKLWFHDLTIKGCWQAAQPLGAAFMLTPAAGGEVVGVCVEDIDLEDCADGVSITGRDASGVNQTQTTDVVIRRLTGRLRAGVGGGHGRGVALMVQRFTGAVELTDSVLDTDGSKLVEVVDQTAALTVSRNVARLGKYGITFGGQHASVTADPFTPNVGLLKVEANRLVGPGVTARWMGRFPLTTKLTEDEFAQAYAEGVA